MMLTTHCENDEKSTFLQGILCPINSINKKIDLNVYFMGKSQSNSGVFCAVHASETMLLLQFTFNGTILN